MDGWIKLWRKSMDSQVWANSQLWQLWCYCLLKANHKDNWVTVDGLTEPVLVKRGQFITGRCSLHKALFPRKKRTTKTPLTVWRWLQMLQTIGNLNIKTNNKYSTVTVCNYETYQESVNENEQVNEQQANNRRTTDEQQTCKNEHKQECNNVKNEKNKETYSPTSDEWTTSWLPYDDKFETYNWTRVDGQGYRLLSKNNPPQKDDVIAEHRWVYQNVFGEIPPSGIIHHKDGDKLNNDPENLLLAQSGQHVSSHRKGTDAKKFVPFLPDSDELVLSLLLLSLILERKPDYKKPDLQKWAIHIDRMLRIDGRDVSRVGEVIRWCQADDFWQNNILSTDKLRVQFDKLELTMTRNTGKPHKTPFEQRMAALKKDSEC